MVYEHGAPSGPLVLSQHGTPSAGLCFRTEIESAKRLGLRLVGFDRAGYGGSTPLPGRRVADAAADVACIADALGAERFATYGASGGGPHALACAALLPERCAAAATVSGVAAADAPDLDFLDGMGPANHEEFGVAGRGREALTAYCRKEAAELTGARPEEAADAMGPHLSDVDAAAMDGEVAAFVVEQLDRALAQGVDGWVDDDLAFLAPWGFELEAITVPVLVVQGEEDLMVPPGHADWLAARIPGAELRRLAGEGHVTLFLHRIGEVHAWLAERLA